MAASLQIPISNEIDDRIKEFSYKNGISKKATVLFALKVFFELYKNEMIVPKEELKKRIDLL